MFFTSQYLSPMNNETLLRKAPAIFADRPASHTSDKYLFIPTIKLIQGLRGEGWEVVSAVQTMTKKSNAEKRDTNKHAIFLARRDMIGSAFNAGDVMPLIKMENSHNAMSSFSLSTGFFRKACANGMTVPESIYAAPTVIHNKNLASDVIDATYKVLSDFPRLVEMQRSLSGVMLDAEEKMLFADAASDVFFTKDERKAMEAVAARRGARYAIDAQLVASRRYEDRKNDLWTVTNVIQENLVRGHVQTTTLDDRGNYQALRSKRKVTSIDRDNDIHEKLFMMTQRFAALKGVQIGTPVVA